MSKTVLINKFDGGIAEDPRTFATDQCQSSLNFDIFTNPHYLQPYPDTVEEFETIGGNNYSAGVPNLTEVFISNFSSSPSGPFVSYGYENDGVTQLILNHSYIIRVPTMVIGVLLVHKEPMT